MGETAVMLGARSTHPTPGTRVVTEANGGAKGFANSSRAMGSASRQGLTVKG